MTVRESIASRELLWNLTLRELRTRYRRSVLGWAWSLLNPLATMVVYSIVFLTIFQATPPAGRPSGLESYPLYLLCGLVPWNFFALSASLGMEAVTGNAALVRKVWFPRELLVVSSSASMFVSMLVEMGLLLVVLLFAGNMVLPWIVPLAVVLLLLAVFAVGVALVLAALNVYYRDVSYLWTIVSQVWFFMTPIIWQVDNQPEWLRRLATWQPMGGFVVAVRNLVYDLRWPSAARWLHISVVAVAAFAFGAWVFSRLSPRFAEEL